jgi:large subunit ribosomal protein L30
MGKIKVTKIRSTIKRPADQKRTMEALGLRKMNSSNEIEDSPQVRGMIRKVSHLLKVEE